MYKNKNKHRFCLFKCECDDLSNGPTYFRIFTASLAARKQEIRTSITKHQVILISTQLSIHDQAL